MIVTKLSLWDHLSCRNEVVKQGLLLDVYRNNGVLMGSATPGEEFRCVVTIRSDNPNGHRTGALFCAVSAVALSVFTSTS